MPQSLGPAVHIVALPVDGTVFKPTSMIITDLAGTGTIVTQSGETLTGFRLTATEQHISIVAVSALATTTKVWGLYQS